MTRELVAGAGVAILAVATAAFILMDREGPLTVVEHDQQIGKLEAEFAPPSSVDVRLNGWPLREYMTVESCESNGLLLRCLAKIKPGYPLEGWRMAAKASKWDGAEFVDLAGTTITAPNLMGAGTSELKILLPDRADMVFLSYRQ